MFLGQSALWAFAEQAGTLAGVSPAVMGWAFTASAFMALVGALAATMIGNRLGFRAPLLLGFIVQLFCALSMYVVADNIAFLAGVLLLNAVGAFTLPFVQAVLVDLDPSGRSASYSGAAINFGGALAPALCAAMALASGMKAIGVISCAIILASLLLVRAALGMMAPAGEPLSPSETLTV
jgi:MFS family permease